MDADILAAREKLKAKYATGGQLGGKGSVRRKKKTVHKATGTDDKRLTATLKRLNVNPIPGIEEVNIFKDDSTVIHFNNPKVQVAIGSNTYVVSGASEIKTAAEVSAASAAGPTAAQLKMLQELAKKSGAGSLDALMSSLGGLSGLGGAGGAGGDEEAMPSLETADFEKVSESS